ncbi:hypothetical protein [Kineobactrum salinum]|uniref:Tetratricopeptide repeat protein n=1 Tax=Kineobactrum salinum TaxID=2708301 RepID=A0A6C0U7D5_9GAMM|nr:hypothetical protein [Kineobactrum salinum]QIB66867.1 hypothetical protein G3T16_17175 [Kineobactrum salinum]
MALVRCSLTAVAALVLVACTTTAPAEPPVAAEQAPATTPELTLNLPTRETCDCEPLPERDLTFLERGFAAVSQADTVAAAEHFQRYKRLESSAEAQWEADIAIAYLSMSPNSPFFDREAASKSYQRLAKALRADMQVHPTTLLLRDALESFVVMHRHIEDLENSNATLKEDLEKREEAIKRLRELTLGQSRANRP